MKNLYLVFAFLFCFVSSYSQGASDLSANASKFINTLGAEQKQKINYSFDDSLRHKWTNLPVGMVPRPGIAYGSLSDESRLAFHRVLSSVLSSQGYLKLTSIMQLDDILNVLYQSAFDSGKIDEKTLKMTQNLNWGHGNYFISIYGTPQDVNPWGLNFGGHHMALNLTVSGKNVTISPYFSGTDPSEVKTDKYAGWRILSKEEDYGFMLLHMLSKDQQSMAILSRETPKDIITNPNSPQRITEYAGVSAAKFNKSQKEMLQILIEEYVHNFEHPIAHSLFSKIMKTGIKKVYFGWIGSTENNHPHYYVIHGPDFLIEYDNVGFQNNGNHIHCILRESGNDFGIDLLQQHYMAEKH